MATRKAVAHVLEKCPVPRRSGGARQSQLYAQRIKKLKENKGGDALREKRGFRN